MRILALETSTLRGSVALVEGGEVRFRLSHSEPNRHAERMLALVAEVFERASWRKETINRVAVGVGPGAFTGIRVGVALAQGLSLGLGAEAVGVGSLQAVALGHAARDLRTRVVLRDARRQEYFLAAYSPKGEELLPPVPIPRQDVVGEVARRFTDAPVVLLGDRVPGLPWEHEDDCQFPEAGAIGIHAAGLDARLHPVVPRYVRGPGADKPVLAPSPLALQRMDSLQTERPGRREPES